MKEKRESSYESETQEVKKETTEQNSVDIGAQSARYSISDGYKKESAVYCNCIYREKFTKKETLKPVNLRHQLPHIMEKMFLLLLYGKIRKSQQKM